MRNRNLEAALAYALRLGLPIFPVHGLKGQACDCGHLECKSPGKHPYTPRGLHDASSEEGIIREWWAHWPNANIGMPTGERSGIFVMDIDLPDGETSLAMLIEANGATPITPTQTTGSGGRQFFFAYPYEPVVRNSASKIGVNIDIRGEGGYVVLPPSRHVTGRSYKWGDDTKIGNLDLADAPDWLINFASTALEPEKPSAGFQIPGTIPDGTRNDTLFRFARKLRATNRGISQESVFQAVRAENLAKCIPPESDTVIRGIVEHAFTLPNRADFNAKAKSEEKELLNANDPMEMARVFTKRDLDRDTGRLTHRWDGRFWHWNGAHYETQGDEDMRELLWFFLQDGALLTNGEKNLIKPSSRIINEMMDALKANINLNMLQHKPPCWVGGAPIATPITELAAVKNGLLHIPSGTLYNASPRFLTLSSIRTDYDPAAIPGEWVNFLDSMWPGEPEQVETLQEMFGYLLTNAMDQQKMFMIIGPPRSGKGTIGQVLTGLLGDGVARPALSQLGDGFGKESLIGRQLAIISDARLDDKAHTSTSSLIEALLSISGQDNIDIDRKHRQIWRGVLHTRFLFLTNELPRMWDASGALPNRFIVLATRISHLGNEDRTLAGRLLKELPGILNWAVLGWRRLQARGYFIQPSTVMELVDQFQTLTNPLGDFVNDDCSLSDDNETSLASLYKSYLAWTEKQGQKYALAINVFARDLRAGWPSLRHKRVGEKKARWIVGIKPNFEPAPAWEN